MAAKPLETALIRPVQVGIGQPVESPASRRPEMTRKGLMVNGVSVVATLIIWLLGNLCAHAKCVVRRVGTNAGTKLPTCSQVM